MYEDLQFPIDVSGVQKDHPFLDADSLQSLFRRLHALNRCAKMKVDNLPKNKADDSDEDDHCALSENWTFQPESRRWSRVCDVTAQHAERLQALCASSQQGSVDRSPGGEPALEPSVGTTGAATAAVAAATPPAASTPATPATPGAGSGGARTPAQPPASPATPAPGTPAAARLLDEDEEDEEFDTEAPVISAFR